MQVESEEKSKGMERREPMEKFQREKTTHVRQEARECKIKDRKFGILDP